MHNWWIAMFEHIGVLTHEQSKRLSEELKNSILKDNYEEAYEHIKAIVGSSFFTDMPSMPKLMAEIDTLKIRLSHFETDIKPAEQAIETTVQKLKQKK